MLRTTLLCLMLALSEEIDQEIIENVSYQLAKNVAHCQEEMESKASDKERYNLFWAEEFDFDVWADGCLTQCVLQRQGLIDRHGNFRRSQAIAFAEYSGADEEQTQQLIAMVTTDCVASELMLYLPEVNQPPRCVKPMLLAICFRNGILESMLPEYRRRSNYQFNPHISQWEKLYTKLSELFTF